MTNQSFRFQDFYDPQPYEPQPAAPAQAAATYPEPYQPPAPEPARTEQQAHFHAPATAPEAVRQPELDWQTGSIVAPGAWTGAQRFGWFLIGALGGILGILVASMSNVGNPYRSEATKMAVIGLIVAVVLSLLAGIGTAMMVTASTLSAVDAASLIGA